MCIDLLLNHAAVLDKRVLVVNDKVVSETQEANFRKRIL